MNMNFKDKYNRMIAEQEESVDVIEDVAVFIFMTGRVPVGGESVVWTDAEFPETVILTNAQQGIAVAIPNDKGESFTIMVPDTDRFITINPEGAYLTFLDLLPDIDLKG